MLNGSQISPLPLIQTIGSIRYQGLTIKGSGCLQLLKSLTSTEAFIFFLSLGQLCQGIGGLIQYWRNAQLSL